jgi:hypothetical protein
MLGPATKILEDRTVIMVLSASQNALSTANPVGTKLERRSDCCMALIPPEKAPRESQTASNSSHFFYRD